MESINTDARINHAIVRASGNTVSIQTQQNIIFDSIADILTGTENQTVHSAMAEKSVLTERVRNNGYT